MSRTLQNRGLFLFSFLIILFFLFSESFGAVRLLSGDKIKSRIRLNDGPIVNESDSLLLSGRHLIREADYSIDYINGVLALNITPGQFDTLAAYFTPLPAWLKRHYGMQPDIQGDTRQVIITPTSNIPQSRNLRTGTAVEIKGAKRFSIISQTGVTSQFVQSLELSIQGELNPGLKVTGSVSDRGYDASYGTVNSRISELDKINLKVESRKFMAEIGNLEIEQSSDFSSSLQKQISGLKTVYHDRKFSAGAVFARPRGEYKSVRFYGNDGVQGPYRIIADNRIRAIVPGSERIWVDGNLLKKGGEDDYVMDYPAATITFTPRVIIDSRSRIEIDFEPLSSDYQRELYQINGGASAGDSLFFLKAGYAREGDDKNRLKSGMLSTTDISLLESIGDSVDQNFITGAVADTSGDYIMVTDSSGNQYYDYVGSVNGDYRVSFTSVGAGNGDYYYEGNGVYRYGGVGSGEYLPIIKIPVPAREEYFDLEMGLHPSKKSALGLILRRSKYDRNLFSPIDDGNNGGGQYIGTFNVGGTPTIGSVQNALSGYISLITKDFKSRTRRNHPDFDRYYLVPSEFVSRDDELNAGIKASAKVPGPYSLLMVSELLDYRHQYNAYLAGGTIYTNDDNSLFPTFAYRRLYSKYKVADKSLDGGRYQVNSLWKYAFSPVLKMASEFSFDRRWNYYTGSLRGTTEKEYHYNLDFYSVQLGLERYEEDTVVTEWHRIRYRNRATLKTSRQFGHVRADLFLIGQRLAQSEARENQFMTRLNMIYSPPGTNLSIVGSYALSDENRYERGLRYIEVELGQGKYILVDGQYIPDPEGNYIELEEIHSSQALVKRGEKSFSLRFNPNDIYLNLQSNITEELLAGGKRSVIWVLPFYTDGREAYLFRRLYHQGDLRLLKHGGYHLINLSASYNFESRRIGEINYEKYDESYRVLFNEADKNWQFSQQITYFRYFRDSYYSSPGDIKGINLKVGIIRKLTGMQFENFIAYRTAKDDNQSKSKIYSLIFNPKVHNIGVGETSFKIELYFQDLTAAETVSYRLTDNKYGKRGALWSLRSDQRITGTLKLTLMFTGQHSNERKPRISGRGEIIASF